MTEANPPPQVLSIADKFDLILKKFDDTKQDIDGKINELRSEFNHTTQDVKQPRTVQQQWRVLVVRIVKQAIWAIANSTVD